MRLSIVLSWCNAPTLDNALAFSFITVSPLTASSPTPLHGMVEVYKHNVGFVEMVAVLMGIFFCSSRSVSIEALEVQSLLSVNVTDRGRDSPTHPPHAGSW